MLNNISTFKPRNKCLKKRNNIYSSKFKFDIIYYHIIYSLSKLINNIYFLFDILI